MCIVYPLVSLCNSAPVFARFLQLALQPTQIVVECNVNTLFQKGARSQCPICPFVPSPGGLNSSLPGTHIRARHEREGTTAIRLQGSAARPEAAPEDDEIAGFCDAANAVAAAVALHERRCGDLALKRCRQRGQRLVMDDDLVVLARDIKF